MQRLSAAQPELKTGKATKVHSHCKLYKVRPRELLRAVCVCVCVCARATLRLRMNSQTRVRLGWVDDAGVHRPASRAGTSKPRPSVPLPEQPSRVLQGRATRGAIGKRPWLGGGERVRQRQSPLTTVVEPFLKTRAGAGGTRGRGVDDEVLIQRAVPRHRRSGRRRACVEAGRCTRRLLHATLAPRLRDTGDGACGGGGGGGGSGGEWRGGGRRRRRGTQLTASSHPQPPTRLSSFVSWDRSL